MEAWNFLRGWKPVFFISKLAQSKINPYKPEYSFCSDLNKKVKDFYTEYFYELHLTSSHGVIVWWVI